METLIPALPPFGCPAPDFLAAFDEGRLAEPEIGAVAAHVSSCDSCAEVLLELQSRAQSDGVVAQVRRCMALAPTPGGPEYARMDAAARAIGSASSQAEWPTGRERTRPAHDAWAGKFLGPYELLRRIGEGGMGVVYLARQPKLERPVALKMVRAGQHGSVRALERFAREGRAIARLNHPNVVHVYDYGEHEGQPYFSMELVERGSLAVRLDSGPLEVREAAELVRTLAEAVHYAHVQGVIHRDLKPSNILLADNGTPKITDFGLAKILDADAASDPHMTLTEANVVLGTASYMAPEQTGVRGSEVSGAADVYALGAILYEALTGEPPFLGKSKADTLELVRNAVPVPPSTLRPEVPRALEAICLKCLEKLPSRRYASAQALADDLGRWLRGERPRETPGLLQRFGRSASRHVAAILVGSVAVSGAAAFYMTRPERTVERLEGALARGRPVTLIGTTGAPKWSRLLTDPLRTHTTVGEDGTFTIQTWSLALLELVPDSRSASYRFSAQVRHERSETYGLVGIYFGRRTFSRNGVDHHYFMKLAFNSVKTLLSPQAMEFLKARSPKISIIKENTVELSPHLYAEKGSVPVADSRISCAAGPRFRVTGADGAWHNLEIVVTPERISARWDGRPFGVSRAGLEASIRDWTSIARRFPPTFEPKPPDRGGLGLLLHTGAASFRRVTVTPL